MIISVHLCHNVNFPDNYEENVTFPDGEAINISDQKVPNKIDWYKGFWIPPPNTPWPHLNP